jgi:hypothetical protein
MKNPPAARFRAFTIRATGLLNRVITPVNLYPGYDPAQSTSTPPYATNGLWDTGATSTVITRATATAMGLIPVGFTVMSTAGGSHQTPTYVINVTLPNGVGIAGVLAGECANLSGNVGALIGMDIISKGDFSITNVGGKTCVSYRIPSVSVIDYVNMSNQLQSGNVAQNEPCPCGRLDANGNRLKYKKCCGKSTS